VTSSVSEEDDTQATATCNTLASGFILH